MAENKLYDAYNQEIELTSEQQACLKYTGEKTLMVKGFAGAGKSLVLMTIAQKYLEKYGSSARNKVALFTFQNTLVSTTREFLHVNGKLEDGVLVSTVNSYVKDIYDYFVRIGKAPRCKYPAFGKMGETQRKKNVEATLKAHQTKYGKHRFHTIDVDFWVEEFDWMKDMNVWTDDLDYYRSLQRKGRGSKVRMSAADRITAYQLYVMYCEHLKKTGQADWADQTLYVVRNSASIPENMKFDHVMVDEAQDLSLAQMAMIMQLYRKDMVVAMDANQKIHNKSWTTKQLGIEATTKKLTKSMRTTKQIDALAESVRSQNDDKLDEDDRSLRAIPEREGDKPKLVYLENQAAERKYVVSLVKAYLKSNPKLTIGIIASKNSQINIYSDWLTSEGVEHEQVTKDTTFSMAKPGVKVVTAYSAKGLEFNCVIIPMFAEGYFPYNFTSDDEEEMEQFLIKMRNLVYVSMTRAKNLLTITWWGKKGSRFIDEMDRTLYEQVGNPPEREKIGQKIKPVNVAPRKQNAEISTKKVDEPVKLEKISEVREGLAMFMKEKGLEVIDKRDKGGCLWVVGTKSIDPYIKESKSKFGALWTYSQSGGIATKKRSGYFTKCDK